MKKQKAFQQISEDFQKTYYKEIMPMMKDWEKKRRIELFKFMSILGIAIFIVILCIEFCIHQTFNEYMLFFAALLSTVIACSLLYNIYLNFTVNLKNECMPFVIKAFGNMKWVSKEDMLKDDMIRSSELFGDYNIRSDDDFFYGKYNEVSYSISETRLLYIVDSGKYKFVKTIFQGVIVNLKANKEIKNKTIIAPKNDWNIRNNCFGVIFVLLLLLLMTLPAFMAKHTDVIFLWIVIIGLIFYMVFFRKPKNREILNEIKLEDPIFNKNYKAYSSDEVEGRYLITPAFMERFKNIQTAFCSRGVKCSFHGDRLVFAISTKKNLFEIGNLFTPFNKPEHLQTFFNELMSILQLIDYFKLNEKTGL